MSAFDRLAAVAARTVEAVMAGQVYFVPFAKSTYSEGAPDAGRQALTLAGIFRSNTIVQVASGDRPGKRFGEPLSEPHATVSFAADVAAGIDLRKGDRFQMLEQPGVPWFEATNIDPVVSGWVQVHLTPLSKAPG